MVVSRDLAFHIDFTLPSFDTPDHKPNHRHHDLSAFWPQAAPELEMALIPFVFNILRNNHGPRNTLHSHEISAASIVGTPVIEHALHGKAAANFAPP
jgi:hypothetical protein